MRLGETFHRFFLGLVIALVAVFGVLLVGAARALFWQGDGAVPFRAVAVGSAVAASLLAILALGGALLVHARLLRETARLAEAIEGWRGWWRSQLRGEDAAPPGAISEPAFEAYAQELVAASEEDRARLLRVGERLGLHRALLARLRRNGELGKLDALHHLGRLRIAEALPPVLELGDARSELIRREALRTAARIAAGLSGSARKEAADRVCARLVRARVSASTAEEVLILLGEGAPDAIGGWLRRSDLAPPLLRAALDAARKLGLEGFDPESVILANHADPDVRAASLRLLGAAKGPTSAAALDAMERGLRSEHAFLRAHAVRALAARGGQESAKLIWERLADESWWVRLAAAESLRSLGGSAKRELETAARSHPDRFARDVAALVGDGAA